ncbi:MAG: hypothetical protein IPN62_17150 [Flavobacteriales bacterium]|nr:hypothetical protein [Flavobacteriales bacterium]
MKNSKWTEAQTVAMLRSLHRTLQHRAQVLFALATDTSSLFPHGGKGPQQNKEPWVSLGPLIRTPTTTLTFGLDLP